MNAKKKTSTLRIEFGGWFQCRLSTDPDPTWEPRGVSGYTRVVGRESDFDRVLRLQRDEIEDRDFRASNLVPASNVGVTVTKASVDGAPLDVLAGAEVRMLRRPEYILWNQIVADGVEQLVPLLVPFEIEIRRKVPGGEIVLRRYDPLVPGKIGDRFWDTGDPNLYRQRLPVDYVHLSSTVMEATGISDFNGYFQMRKEWLQLEITDTVDPVEREALQVRLLMLDAASQTTNPTASPGLIENRLGLQCVWEHPIRGESHVSGEKLLGGKVLSGGIDDRENYWHTRFWHGGWDGDLLRCYMQGTLNVPFRRKP